MDPNVGEQRALGARRLLAQVDALAERMFERVLRESAPASLLPDLSPDLRAAGIAVARTDLAHELTCMAGDELPSTCPAEVRETARRTVALGAPLSFPLQCYRVGHRVLWDAWSEWTEPLPTDLRDELRRAASDFFFDYAERCCAFLTAAHADELARARSGLAQRHLELARRILDGTGRPSHIGDYTLDALHLAVVISGPGAATAATHAETVSGRRALRIPLDDETIWLWLDTAPPTDSRTFATRLGADATRHATVGVGAPGAGIDGFARSHRQAQQALRIALTRAASVLSYDEAALDAVATADQRVAEDFAHHILAPIANDPKLIATLASWIAHQQSAAAAAVSLGVSERTVNNRLRATERKLGRPLRGSTTAVEIAIRIRHVLSRDPVG
jgi:hypothetical protein